MVKIINIVLIDKKCLCSMGGSFADSLRNKWKEITQYNSIFLSEHLKGSSWKPQNCDSGVALIQITKTKELSYGLYELKKFISYINIWNCVAGSVPTHLLKSEKSEASKQVQIFGRPQL